MLPIELDEDSIQIRTIANEEIPVLEDMLYEAIFQEDEANPIPREVIELPEVKIFIKDFGKKKHDHCFVADWKGKIIGAVWVRLLNGTPKGFGYIDEETPEFAISLFKEYRHMGLGTSLMKRMIEHLKETGYQQTSLSVQKKNYALKLYQKLGFEIIKDKGEDYLMLLKL